MTTDAIIIEEVEFWYVLSNGEMDFRCCDLCCENFMDDPPEGPWRTWHFQRGGFGDGLTICGECLEGYLNDEEN